MSLAAAIVVLPGAGEVIGDSPERRVEILCEQPALHATWSRFGPGREGADLHVHREHHDVFYVLAGEVTVRLGVAGDEVVARPGQLLCVPPLVVHGFRNAGPEELRYLNFHAPGSGFAGYMRGLRDGRRVLYDQHDPPADGGRAISDVIAGATSLSLDHLQVSEAAMVPGGVSPRLEAFFVLEGEVEVNAASAAAGSWVTVPAGVEHTVAAREPARLLRVSA